MAPDNVSARVLLYFNPTEAANIDALADQIIPDEDGSPGAVRAGVTEYIDRGLAGFLRDLQPTYRSGLLALGKIAQQAGGREFADLDQVRRRLIVGELERTSREQPDDFAGQFFRIVREHTIQGFFCDPAYGGNQDLAGWRLVGFPGAQWEYTPEQMRPGTDATAIPMFTISDLYRRHGGSR